MSEIRLISTIKFIAVLFCMLICCSSFSVFGCVSSSIDLINPTGIPKHMEPNILCSPFNKQFLLLVGVVDLLVKRLLINCNFSIETQKFLKRDS